MRDPCNLSSETLNVILLLLQHILRHEQRERTILDPQFLDPQIKPCLDLLPDEVGSGLKQISRVLFSPTKNHDTPSG